MRIQSTPARVSCRHHLSVGLLFLVTAITLVFVAAAAVDANAGEWKGTETVENGVKIIMNPAEPMEKAAAHKMEELWRLGGYSDDEDEFFGVIADIEIDEAGNVYLLDSQLAEIKIYTKDGEFIRSIGREGEGPGEFRLPSATFFTKDGNVGVLQTMPGKVVILTKEGEPVGDMPLPEPEDGGFQILQGGQSGGGNLVLFMARQEFDQEKGRWARTGFLASVSEDGKMLTEYTSKTNEIIMSNAVMHDAAWDTFDRRWNVGPDGRVYAATSYEDYTIEVWKADGTKDRVLKRPYEHRPRTQEEIDFMKTMFDHWAQRIPDCKVKIEENCKDIDNFFVRDDGSIWVLTSDGARDNPDGTLGIFDVLNADGHFVRNVTLEGDGDARDDLYLFVKDRLYVVTDFLQAAMSAQGVQGLYDEEEEPEPMEVICYKLDRDVLSAR